MAFKDRADMQTRPRSDGRDAPVGASKPTGAAAFVAREKGRGASRIGLMLATVGAVSLGAGLGAWALYDPTPSAEPTTFAGAPAASTAVATADERTANSEAERRDRSEAQAALARLRDRQAHDIAESQKQIEALQKRRDELQQQVAELTAPLAPSADELETATRELDAAKAEAAQREATVPEPADEIQPEEARPVEKAASIEPPEVISAPSEPRAPAPRSKAQVDVAAAPAIEVDRPANTDVQPSSGPVRVFIHIRAQDRQARVRALAIANDLRRRGVEVAGIRGVPHAVRNDMVRFFYDADESAVTTLGQALETSAGRGAPITQDFRNRRVAPKPGTLEIWLS